MSVDDDAAPISAADTLKLIDEQRTTAERGLTPDPRLIYWPWGIAWFVGFGLLFLRFGPGGRVLVDLPDWLPLSTLYALMLVALVISGLAGMKVSRHVSGASAVTGALYGFSWFLGFAGFSALAIRLSPHLPPQWSGLLWAGGHVGVVGLMYLAGGAIWRTRDLYGLGLWITAVNVIGIVAGPGWHSLVISIGAGCAMVFAGQLASRQPGRWF
jgi:hypothetical protein